MVHAASSQGATLCATIGCEPIVGPAPQAYNTMLASGIVLRAIKTTYRWTFPCVKPCSQDSTNNRTAVYVVPIKAITFSTRKWRNVGTKAKIIRTPPHIKDQVLQKAKHGCVQQRCQTQYERARRDQLNVCEHQSVQGATSAWGHGASGLRAG